MKKVIFALALAHSSAYAALEMGYPAELVRQTTPAMNQALEIDGLYQVKAAKQVYVNRYIMGDKRYPTSGDVLGYVLEEGAPIRIEHLRTGELRLYFGLIGDDAKTLPAAIEISPDQLSAADLQFLSYGDQNDLQLMYSYFAYRGSENASRGQVVARRHRTGGWGDGGCVNYIKRVTGIYGHLGNGVSVASSLARTGRFHWTTCQNPQVGTIASWAGHGAGHTARWDGHCWRTDVSRACSVQPKGRQAGDPGTGYRFAGCVI